MRDGASIPNHRSHDKADRTSYFDTHRGPGSRSASLTQTAGRCFPDRCVSDFLSFWTVLAPPMQWVIDLGTALLLFLILGRRWVLLPGLIAEAIPGMGVFPVWILVVLSIILYDDIKGSKH